jgi:hypothetical protein
MRRGLRYNLQLRRRNEQRIGTLQQEHFEALENFWNQVVESPMKEKGSTKASAVLVLPEDYGCGMRSPEDKIWGICDPDQNSNKSGTCYKRKLSNMEHNWT